ncbi:MAG: hypothetical protein NVS3B10_16690 [Polyangiales bacterium]
MSSSSFLVLALLAPACSSGSGDSAATNAAALDATATLTLSSSLTLSSTTVASGTTLTAALTYTNPSCTPIAVAQVAIAARPPGGTHAGGPYDDLMPHAGAGTVAAGGSLVLSASRTFAAGDPAGTWVVYPTYQDASGNWHDGPEQAITVVAGKVAGTGGFSTSGNQIVDETGQSFRIASVGWNEIGAGPIQGFDENVVAMKSAGFNCIRVSWVNARKGSDLANIDQVVAAASRAGLRVILDNHTNEPGHGDQDNWGAQQKNGLWYDVGGASDGTDGGGNAGTVSDATFLSDWVSVAQHYAGNATVIGFDLRNEPLAYAGASTWGSGNPDTDIRLMYQRVGNAVLAVDPGKLIIAEGPQSYTGNFAGKGPAPWGDLSVAGTQPVVLNVPNKVVYSVHDYPHEIANFSPDNGAAKVALMNDAWGYLVTKNIAPVWIGEMGSSMNAATDAAWAQTMLDYLNGQAGALGGPTFGPGQKGIGTDWWAWGNLAGQLPEGTQNADGSLRSAQYDVYSKLR